MFTEFHPGIHFTGVAHFNECVAQKVFPSYIGYSVFIKLSIKMQDGNKINTR